MSDAAVVVITGLLGLNAIMLAFILREVRQVNRGAFLTMPINCYGEGIGDAIQGQLVRGQNGISQYDR